MPRPDIVAIIPARAGSQGVPKKNVRLMAGEPMISWTLKAALAAPGIGRVIVSTDDPVVSEIAKSHGAEVPFRRPPELCTDSARISDVVIHALDWLRVNGSLPDYTLLLQPTSPLRQAADVASVVRWASEVNPEAIVGVTEAKPHPYLAKTIGPNGELNDFIPLTPEMKSLHRQDMPPCFVVNGAIYLNKTKSFEQNRTFAPLGSLAFLMPLDRSIDVDNELDFLIAEYLLVNLNARI